LNEKVENSPLSETKKKDFTNYFWYKLTNDAKYYNKKKTN